MPRNPKTSTIIGTAFAIMLLGLGALWLNREQPRTVRNDTAHETINTSTSQTVVNSALSDPNFVCYPRYVETVEVAPNLISVDVSEVQWYTIDQNRQIIDHFSKTESVIVEETFMTAILGDDQVEKISLLSWNGETAIFRVKHESPDEKWECDFTAVKNWDVTDQE